MVVDCATFYNAALISHKLMLFKHIQCIFECGASPVESLAAKITKNMLLQLKYCLMTALMLILPLNDPHNANFIRK